MHCAGAAPHAAPCARAELPAAGLTNARVYGTLMACCRSMRGCAAMRGCPMGRPGHASMAAQRATPATSAAISSRRCLITIHVSTSVPPTLAASHARWLLIASPALAPPAPLLTVSGPQAIRVTFWTYTPVLSPHVAPCLHGLRAPPVV